MFFVIPVVRITRGFHAEIGAVPRRPVGGLAAADATGLVPALLLPELRVEEIAVGGHDAAGPDPHPLALPPILRGVRPGPPTRQVRTPPRPVAGASAVPAEPVVQERPPAPL